jgi:large subunit ribosomal protein L10
MAVTKQKKVEILDELRQIFSEDAVLLLTTNGAKNPLSAVTNYEYRSTMDNGNVKVTIAKNTLIRLALKEKGVELGQTYGQTYVQVLPGGDEVTVIKTVLDSVKDKFKDNFKVYGSVVKGEFMDPAQTEALSKVPTYKESMSMVASSLNSIIAKIAIGVKEVPTSIARGVGAIKKKYLFIS